MPSPSKAPNTTTAEAKLFRTILMNLEHKPSVDWDFIAQACGYKDAKSAQERFRQIRIRFNAKDYVDGKRSVSTPSKLKVKRAAAETEMTPSPSSKMPKLDTNKSSSARKRSTLGPKVIHTTWTPTNATGTERPARSKIPTTFNAEEDDGMTTEEDLAGTGVSVLDFGKRVFTPEDTDGEDAYKEDSEGDSWQEDYFEDVDQDSESFEM